VLLRFFLYGLIGWCAEVLWTASYDLVSGTVRDPGDRAGRVSASRGERLRLTGRTYLWMLPIYGAGGLLFERAHDALRATAWPLRALIYVAGFFAGEALAGLALKVLTGRCPWDYSYARLSVLGGVIRLDYAPVWMAFAFFLERAHDVLAAVEAPLRAAL
jgi:hypothetical protein